MTQDLSGQVFGRLTAVQHTGKDKNHNALWECRCSCGALVMVNSNKLKTKHTRSCGCLVADKCRELRTTHGFTKDHASPTTYNIWVNMRQRCANPNNPKWKDYGGRGITVCERWQDFSAFVADMGETPPGKTIERIDNDVGYTPDNCIWASNKVQSRNKQNTLYITMGGETTTLAEACEKHGIPYKKGWRRYHDSNRTTILA